ncbi:hypothetical protein BJX63DRAFT_406556 [Aspergillus granulosus]|uniref:MULE transposase domain-containing protein n=1 Tax=Aspergillus granulosus TaxID=176169 RepID=A0ABR4H162_9EURO
MLLLSRFDGDKASARTWHRSYTCSGIKHCPQIDQQIFLSGKSGIPYDDFNRVDPRFFKCLWRHRRTAYRRTASRNPGSDDILSKTEHYYLGFLANWQYTIKDQPVIAPCTYNGHFTCPYETPALFTLNGAKYIGCQKHSDLEPWHRIQPLQTLSYQLDELYLQSLIDREYKLENPSGKCAFITSVRSGLTQCDQPHSSGSTSLLTSKCNARFDLFIPENWDRFPYIMLVTRGRHTHPPPPPSGRPLDVANEVIDAIKKHDFLTPTARRLLISPRWLDIQRRFGSSVFRTLHASLNVGDHITSLIRKERLLHYRGGTDIAGILREFNFDQKRPYNQWIRDVFFLDKDARHYIILCCTDQQASAFQKAQFIHVDISLQKVQGKTNLYSVSGWSEEHQCTVSYAHAFINLDSRKAYHIMFRKMFEMLAKVSRQDVHFTHIHNTQHGIRAITTDMCMKQGPGLGDYLHEIHPALEWDEHLLHILIFCQVYLKRSFRKKFGDHPAKEAVYQLWNSPTRDAFFKKMEGILKIFPRDYKLRRWLEHKASKPWILGALCPGQSKMDPDYWKLVNKYIAISESSHSVDNDATDQKLSLLDGVLRYIYPSSICWAED